MTVYHLFFKASFRIWSILPRKCIIQRYRCFIFCNWQTSWL